MLIKDRRLAAKLEVFHPHLVLNFSCISHFLSESSKNLRNLVKCRTTKAHVQCFLVLNHHLQCFLASLFLRQHSQHQRRHQLFFRQPRDLSPRQYRRQMGNQISFARCPFRPLDGILRSASAVSAKSRLPKFLNVGIIVPEKLMAIGVSSLLRS